MERTNVEQWKKDFGAENVLKLILGEGNEQKNIFVKSPTILKAYFATISQAISLTEQDRTIEAGELILRSCYLGGDLGDKLEDYNKETQEYVSACFYCSQLIRLYKGNFQTT